MADVPAERLSSLEERFSSHSYEGRGPELLIEEGSIPILVSAPHAVTQTREGEDKRAEILTGALALWLLSTYAKDEDDANGIARLSPDLMKLAGVEDNDRICVRFGSAQAQLRVLVDEGIDDSRVSLPAGTRAALGVDSVNDVVTVERKESHILRRSMDLQLIALLGTVIAVFQLGLGLSIQILICLVLFPIISWAALNEERVKVR